MNKYRLIIDNKYTYYEDLNYYNPYKTKNKKDMQGLICFYNNDLIYRVIKRKTDGSFKKLLELIIRMEEDDNPGEGYLICLNEIDKFRHEMINKYEKYLKKEQMNFLKRKIDLIEKDLKNKLLFERIKLMENEKIEENEISFHR